MLFPPGCQHKLFVNGFHNRALALFRSNCRGQAKLGQRKLRKSTQVNTQITQKWTSPFPGWRCVGLFVCEFTHDLVCPFPWREIFHVISQNSSVTRERGNRARGNRELKNELGVDARFPTARGERKFWTAQTQRFVCSQFGLLCVLC